MKIRIGDKVVEADMVNGVPTVKATVEQIKREDGTVHVIVNVPCLKLAGGLDGKHTV